MKVAKADVGIIFSTALSKILIKKDILRKEIFMSVIMILINSKYLQLLIENINRS